MTARPWLGALAIDAAVVLLFATGGRDSHDEAVTVASILGVAAPFLIGLVAAAALAFATRTSPVSWRGAAMAWSGATVIGLLLRRLAWDRGTALSFVIVTAIVFAVAIFGWRILWGAVGRRSSRPA